jgi:NAD(P)H-hydrate epimerase
MATLWGEGIEPLAADVLAGADVIIDAMFGAGLSRALDTHAAAVVRAINAAGKPVIAVDVPSGLDGSTGFPVGDAVVRATRTVTFFRLKPGHLLLPGRQLCGDVRLVDIGIPLSVLADIAPQTFANRPDLWLACYPWPSLDGHKYTRGHAVAVSGPPDMTGAARLTARGALRMGAGLVTVVGSGAATAINATHLTAVMVRATPNEAALLEFLADKRCNAVVIGPGAGATAATAASVLSVLNSGATVVLDADAITAFAPRDEEAPVKAAGLGFVVRSAEPEPGGQGLFEAIKSRGATVVMTPHEGEFARLFGEMKGSKLDRARQAVRESGAVIVLKGPDTVIASPDGRAAINHNAPPWLATAGSGDVLAGFITGLVAQGMPAFEAACAGVWLHGECANALGMGLIAEELPEVLPQVLARLRSGV